MLIAMLSERLPEQTRLLPNYPNPFNPETWIPFELSQDSEVSVTIYNVAGTPVRSISVGYLQAGSYVSQSRAIYWDGKIDTGERVASGTYFYTLKTEGYTSTQKMIILK
ncbi:TPA: T9SS type A sorting domain-containing protein [Candidatus Poribacteria bacterium]|nr:T9SS type A sorting domain-containing protein [Candidatus Poribacteria bacterium]